MSEDEAMLQAALDVTEACADALLSAAAMTLIVDGQVPVDPSAVRGIAVSALDSIIARSTREGAKPR